MTGWEEFLHWAQRFAESVDLDAEERAYKVRIAERLAIARPAVMDEDPAWPEEVRRGITSNQSNLLNQFFLMSFFDDLKKRPQVVRQALADVWREEPRVEDLTTFAERLRPLGERYTLGNVTALASLLFMSQNAAAYPPYRPRPTEAWRKLVGKEKLGDGADQRYQLLLDLCDDLLGRSGSLGPRLRDRLDAQGLAWAVLNYPAPRDWSAADRDAFSAWRGDKVAKDADADDEVDNHVERGAGAAPAVEDATWLVLGRGLRGEPSIFDPQVVTWTEEVAEELRRRIEDEPDLGGDSFLEKLRRQLDGASRAVVLLAAELLYVQMAPLTNLKPKSKLDRIETVLSWLDPVPEVPSELVRGLNAPGAFNGGAGSHIQIWQQVTWLCRFVKHWVSQPESARAEALRDPWAFREVAAGVEHDWASIRLSLQYLAWPGTFPWLVNSEHRKRIRDAFADRIGGATGKDDLSVERDLVAIRAHLEPNVDGYIEWYAPPYSLMWMKGKDEGQRAWLVRAKQAGSELVSSWISDGFVSLVAQHLGQIEPGSSLAAIKEAVEAGYQHLDYAQRLSLASEYHSFLTTMKPDDLVVTVADDVLRVGVITGEPYYAAEADSRLRRTVTWSEITVARRDLASPVPSLLDGQGTVVDLTAGLSVLAGYMNLSSPVAAGDVIEAEPRVPLAPDVVPTLPRITDELAASLYMQRRELQEIIDVLQARQQIVFYGPPGTGKTYLAKKLADFLVGPDDPSRTQLVQFHPSYAYEDFFEGFRPTETSEGQATFRLQPGPLRRLAAEAGKEENRGTPYILIIDELNRANLAKVFGELYFLLEYRDESIRLQYNPTEQFRLPKNLFIVGTMNTSDRSIAMMDAAIRRRFAFVELHPDEAPVKGVLQRFVAANHKDRGDERVALLRALNAAIDPSERDLRMGPSYLMKPDAETPGGLERVWKYDLLPLLEEHYYGRLNRDEVHARFGLEVLRAQVAVEIPADPSEETSTESDPGVEAVEPGPVVESVNEDGVES